MSWSASALRPAFALDNAADPQKIRASGEDTKKHLKAGYGFL